MHCRKCFHYAVCGTAGPDSDPTMCKQYIDSGEVLCGSALKVVNDNYDELKKRIERLRRDLRLCEVAKEELEREVGLLRIIKQTLEMQSGMQFDF